ncbi:uncharacterized protein CLUP02_10224 [Colletotrichum lupini]|uniref:Uncharacterized protein n=1 Tax=Colletotrichum lupini TaxID=145971 RepID=A0A9Q8WIC0_9PEZI|nr:uncharacterized protein CLUP02_10224 [Colletotrichum lupini]UQC84728.1 hypothetical protein CLUP02_10224 [Colletotrichum lupini]
MAFHGSDYDRWRRLVWHNLWSVIWSMTFGSRTQLSLVQMESYSVDVTRFPMAELFALSSPIILKITRAMESPVSVYHK